jgi:hypothetical protein
MKLNQPYVTTTRAEVFRMFVCSAFAALLLTACASLGVPTPQSFNEKEALAISTVTAARNTTLTLLTAGKITAQDAQNIQKQCDNSREAISVADTLHASDPTGGMSRLDVAVAGLTALQKYLNTRQ